MKLEKKGTHIVIDAGNSQVKIAIFEHSMISEIIRISFNELLKNTSQFEHLYRYTGIISSVLNEMDTLKLKEIFSNAQIFTSSTRLPIQIEYETPQTLGKDRIANAVAGFSKSKSNTVTIDIGTCIKFDYTTANGVYHGGSISPGIDLRYKSLNDFTANLPLLSAKEKATLVGKSTTQSITSGVINGIQAEINHLILRYSHEFKDLTFFVTGGDSKHFDFPAKSNIFANENLTLEGLYQIFLLNEC